LIFPNSTGAFVGTSVGVSVGALVGSRVGAFVGISVGASGGISEETSVRSSNGGLVEPEQADNTTHNITRTPRSKYDLNLISIPLYRKFVIFAV
jgi:hypothetical protein